MPSGELRRLSAADTDFNKLFATLVVSAWVLVAVGDGRSLFVSSLLKPVKVPLGSVESVVQNRMRSRARVIVSVRQLTPFGSEIVFSARGNWVPFTSGQDVAAELRMLVARARAEEQAASVFRSRDGQSGSGRS